MLPMFNTYNSIMRCLAYRGHQVDVQILDNKVSADFKRTIVEDWWTIYQLLPPSVHWRNIAERAMRTFKARFLSVLPGVDPTFPNFMWDNLLVQTELTLNLLFRSTLNPSISAWEYFNGAFDYTATPLGPIGFNIIIHTTSNKRKSWEQRGREWFSVVPELHHYRWVQAIYSKTKSLLITYTAEYLHTYLTQPHVTAEDRITHSIHFLSAALKDVPNSICDSQLAAIEAVRKIFAKLRTVESLPPASPKVLPPPKPIVPIRESAPIRYPAPTSKGDQGRNRVTTSKGASQQQPIIISKKIQVAANYKGDQ